MSVIVAMTEQRRLLPGVPVEIAREIALFLAAGNTGQIVLHAKQGRVLAADLTHKVRPSDPELDSNRVSPQDSGS